jgi:hypothetical protein
MMRSREEVRVKWVGKSDLKSCWRFDIQASILITLGIDSINFHFWNPRHPLGLWSSRFRSIGLSFLFPWCVCFFCYLFLSLSFDPHSFLSLLKPLSVRPTSTPSLIHPYHSLSYLCIVYLIYDAMMIRLDQIRSSSHHSCTILPHRWESS